MSVTVKFSEENATAHRFVLSYGDTVAEGVVELLPDQNDGTVPVRITYSSGKPNITGPSGPVDPDVYVMAEFMERAPL